MYITVKQLAEKVNNKERFTIDELQQKQVNQEEYYPTIYYHGFKNPFTYRCGYCHFSIKETDTMCKACNKKIAWEKGEK